MIVRRSLVLLCTLVSPALPAAQLLKDINDVPQVDQVESARFLGGAPLAAGSMMLLDDAAHGQELWITDGTPAGTRLVRDIRPGPESSNIIRYTVVAGVAYFFADDGTNGIELWRSDGTTNGTHIVADIGAGATSFSTLPIYLEDPLPVLGNLMFFTASDASGEELWRSDGTAAGTYRITDITPIRPQYEDIRDLVVAGNRLYFLAIEAVTGQELWTSDGSPAGTHRVADIGPGLVFSNFAFLTPVGGNLYFMANDGVHGVELWRTTADGSEAQMVADLNTLPEADDPTHTRSSRPSALFAFGDSVIFEAATMSGTPQNPVTRHALYRYSPASNTFTELALAQSQAENMLPIVFQGGALMLIDGVRWLTDGTAAGTAPLEPSLDVEFQHGTLVNGSEAFFFARDSTVFNGTYDLWRTDGTLAGTRIYANLDELVVPYELVAFDGRLYFSHAVFSPGFRMDLWTTDGTPAGTHAAFDATVTASIRFVSGVTVNAGRLLFGAYDEDADTEPWVSDGTSAGTQRLADLHATTITRDSDILILGSIGAEAFLEADDGVHGRELWASNGTPAGTRMVREIRPGAEGASLSYLFEMNGFALFSADDGVHGSELWRTDGTANGTFLVKDVDPGAGHGVAGIGPPNVVKVGNYLYFSADDGVHGEELWRSDGTGAGTSIIADLTPGDTGFTFILPVSANSRFLVRTLDKSGAALWSSDGTAAGTVLLNTSLSIEETAGAAVFQNRVCFLADEAPGPHEIYCSNGTPGNLERISDFASQGVSPVGGLMVVNGRLLVDAVVPGGVAGGGLYASGGTIASFGKISDLHFLSDGIHLDASRFASFVPVVSQFGTGSDILVTDGTAAGTHSMLTINAPPRERIRGGFGLFNGALVIQAYEPSMGPVLWRIDGTSAGARFLADVDPGVEQAPQISANMLQLGPYFFFVAHRERIGTELWVLTANNPNAADDVGNVAYGTPAAINVLANDGVFSGSLSGASVEIVTAPASGTTSIDFASGAITYTPNAGFTGIDEFTYRVADGLGNFSNPAAVKLTIDAAVSNVAPAVVLTSTPPPPPPPTPNPPVTSPSGGGGGGGAFGIELLPLAFLALMGQRRRPRRVPRRVSP
jgi:ELWxxDGT repeat protein